MPSQMPSDISGRKVRDFGIGTYDSDVGSEYNAEGDFEAYGESLPTQKDDRGTPEPVVGDAYSPSLNLFQVGAAGLPGDLDRPARSKKKPEDSIIQTVVPSVAESQLPYDKHNPPARSDYYDKTKIGETALPGVSNNEKTLDKFLGSLGNWWSGWAVDDISQATSFPDMDRPPEEVDKQLNVPTGLSSFIETDKRGLTMQKQATNLDLVGTITSDFLKKHGKTGLTRRHVMAFLSEGGFHQYLASDVLRCLQQRHDIHVADVLDQFPISTKTASTLESKVVVAKGLVHIKGRIASISVENEKAAELLNSCKKMISSAIADLVRGLEDD